MDSTRPLRMFCGICKTLAADKMQGKAFMDHQNCLSSTFHYVLTTEYQDQPTRPDVLETF